MSHAEELTALRAMLREVVQKTDPPPSHTDMRAAYDAWGASYPLADGVSARDENLGGVACITLEAAGGSGGPVVLYLHGGGYAIGSALSHRHLAAQIASAAGGLVHALDYRLAPEHPFPAAVEDAVAAYRALLDSGVAPGRIFVAGDSAGGGLTVAAALAARDAGLPQPAGLFAISPWVDLGQNGASYEVMAEADLIVTRADLDRWADAYLQGQDAAQPLASPVRADFSGLAPLLIHVGSDEVLLSDSIALAQAAGLARVEVSLVIAPDMPHVWHYMWAHLGVARAAIVDAAAWMNARVAA